MAETKIKVTADTSQAERAISNLERSLEGLQSASGAAAKALAGITAAAGAVTYAVMSTLESAGQLIDAANAIGMSAQNLDSFRKAAILVGVGADQLDASLIRLGGNIGSALVQGSGAGFDALQRLNIPVREIAAMKPEDQFMRIATAIKDIPNPAERSALAIDMFGKAGPRLLAVADNLARVKEEAKAMGLALSDVDVAALDMAGDKVDELNYLFSAGLKKAVAEIAPYIVAIVNKIKESIIAAGGFEVIWGKIKEVIKSIVNIFMIIATIIAARLVVGAAMFAVELGKALVTAKGLSAVLARTPIGLLTAGIALAADYFGVDLVGGATEFLDVNLDVNKAMADINDAAEELKKKNEENVQISDELNKKQKDYLDSLKDTITAKQNEVQYQQDILKLGEEEARIKKALNDEDIKARKAQVDTNSKLYQDERARLETALRQEESAKRQNTLLKDQWDIAKGLYDSQTAYGKEMLKLSEVIAVQNGMTKQQWEESRKRDEEALQRAKIREKTLVEEQMTRVKKEVDNELAKYDSIIAADVKYQEQKKALDEILNQHKAKGFILEADQYKALIDAKKLMDAEYEEAKYAAMKANAERLYQVELSRIQRVLEANKTGLAQQLSAQDQAILQQKGAQERQAQIVQDRIAFEKKSETEKAAFVIDQGAQMFSALGAHNKKAFEAAKAFNIANAIMNTYMGATKALATYPPPFNFIAAAAVIGMGLAQVATIRNQQYSGRQLGGPVMNNQPYIVGEAGPELFVPNTTGSITRNSDLMGGGAPVNVNFTIVANDTTGFDQLLTSRQGVIKQLISDAMLERGQRSIV